MPEIASQQFAMLRMFLRSRDVAITRVRRRVGPAGPEATQDRVGGLVCVLVGRENAGSLLLAAILFWQGEQTAIHFLEPRVFGLGIDLAKDRSVERGVGCRAAWARPQAFDLHRFDHRLAIHRLLRLGQDRNRSFDLAHLLIRWFRFFGGGFGDRGALLGRFGCSGLAGGFGVTVGFGGGLGSHVRVPMF